MLQIKPHKVQERNAPQLLNEWPHKFIHSFIQFSSKLVANETVIIHVEQ